MELCANGHREVCYAIGGCPVCEEMNETAEAVQREEDLAKELEAAQEKIKELEIELDVATDEAIHGESI